MTEKQNPKQHIIRPFPVRYVRNTILRRSLLVLTTPVLVALNVVLVVIFTVPRLLLVHSELVASFAKYWNEHEDRGPPR